jgi:hypothetical protein
LVTLEKLSLRPLTGWIAELEVRLPKPDEEGSDETPPLPSEAGLELRPEEPLPGAKLPFAGGYEEPLPFDRDAPPKLLGEGIPVPLPPRVLPPPKAPLLLVVVAKGSVVLPAVVEEVEPREVSAKLVPPPSGGGEGFARFWLSRPRLPSALPPAYGGGGLLFDFVVLQPVKSMPKPHAPINVAKGILPIGLSSPVRFRSHHAPTPARRGVGPNKAHIGKAHSHR